MKYAAKNDPQTDLGGLTLPEVDFVEGNDAIARAAIKAGCRYFFGYPITPQTEILESMARELPEVRGFFLQAESEVAAINMVIGAASTGARAMTATSSPGISLMQEGISYLASMELPCVIVDVSRAGPGLGRIPPAQSDYFQATKKGHGDFNLIVLAPASVQEMIDLTLLAFDLADKYRNPAMILCDGMLGHLMESIEWPKKLPSNYSKDWAVGQGGGRLIVSAPLTDPELIELNVKLKKKYEEIKANEPRWEELYLDDAEIVIVSFGTIARIAQESIDEARSRGIKVGMIRPITLWPFPDQPFENSRARVFLSVEMNNGQMVQDVKLAVGGKAPVHFFGKGGGWVPSSVEIREEIERVVEGIGCH